MTLKPVVWDAFIFSREFDCLDMRMHELRGLVHRHLLVESHTSFQGNEKPCYYQQGKFVKGRPGGLPVIDRQIGMKGGAGPWQREAAQREAVIAALAEASALDDDWVLFSDADEIPSGRVLAEMMRAGEQALWAPQMSFEQHLCFYYVNNVCTTMRWHGTQLLTFGELKHRGGQVVRDLRNQVPTVDGGWHFCNLGDAEWLREKIQSFSHAELNRPEITDLGFLNKMIKERKVIEPPDEPMEFELDDSVPPEWVQRNREKLAHLYPEEVEVSEAGSKYAPDDEALYTPDDQVNT